MKRKSRTFASIVVTYYIKFFLTGADRRNGILMSLLLRVAEIIKLDFYFHICLWFLKRFDEVP